MYVLTFVVGGVVDAEISVPDDGQLHGKTTHLHPIIEILSPWQPERKRGSETGKRVCVRGRGRERENLFSHFKLSIMSSVQKADLTIVLQNTSSTGGCTHSEHTHELTHSVIMNMQRALKDEIIFHSVL